MGVPAAVANDVVHMSTAPGANKGGVFTPSQSLITFPVTTAAVTTIWKVLGNIHPPLGSNNKIGPRVSSHIVREGERNLARTYNGQAPRRGSTDNGA
jgi:hypothetical protein